MPRSKWKLDATLTCPQCEKYNALTCGTVGYECRDCGYLYQIGAPRCQGCEGPITKRCGLHCYERARGFILRADGSTRHFFQSFVDGNMQYVEDRDYAWFTRDRDVATAMVLDLALRADEYFEVVPSFEVIPHSH